MLDTLYPNLLMREQLVEQGSQLDTLLSAEFLYISQDGRQLNKAEFQAERDSKTPIKNFELLSVSQKTKLIRYEIGRCYSIPAFGAATKYGKTSFTKRHEKTSLMIKSVWLFLCNTSFISPYNK